VLTEDAKATAPPDIPLCGDIGRYKPQIRRYRARIADSFKFTESIQNNHD